MQFMAAASRDVTDVSFDSPDQINLQVCYSQHQSNVQNEDEEQEVPKPSSKIMYDCTSKKEVKNRFISIGCNRLTL